MKIFQNPVNWIKEVELSLLIAVGATGRVYDVHVYGLLIILRSNDHYDMTWHLTTVNMWKIEDLFSINFLC